MAQEGSFRRDLYFASTFCRCKYRPCARARKTYPPSLPILSKNHQGVPGRSRIAFNNDMLATLNAHNWPGNVRELEHILVADLYAL